MSMNPNNICSFIGRLTRDPELRKTGKGKSVTSFSLAVDRNYPDENNNWPSDFIDFVAWDVRAEKIAESWKKGDLVTVSGPLQIRPYKDKDGNNRVAAEVIVLARRKLSSSGKNALPSVPENYDYPPIPSDSDYTALNDNEQIPFPVGEG